ncbi:uncharacterized protein [Oscarella lobularis]|uniref:uncharacterized protein n=1 Tax=Oscarella lobularis TaxID=121494 RepID=UPI0033133D6F
MATYAWSYKTNFSGTKAPDANARAEKVTDEDRKRASENAAAMASKFAKMDGKNEEKKKRYPAAQRIYVGRMSWDTDELALGHFFSTFGSIEEVKIIRDKKTQVSRGFGFVAFSSAESAEQARKYCVINRPILDRREIVVESIEQRRARQQIFGGAEDTSDEEALGDESDKRTNLRGPPEKDGGKKARVLAPVERKIRDDTLYWQFKWSLDPNSSVHGPYSTKHMAQWSEAGYFAKAPCWVRQLSEADLDALSKLPDVPDDDPNAKPGRMSQMEEIAVKYNSNLASLSQYDDESSDSDEERLETVQSQFVPVADIDFSIFP